MMTRYLLLALLAALAFQFVVSSTIQARDDDDDDGDCGYYCYGDGHCEPCYDGYCKSGNTEVPRSWICERSAYNEAYQKRNSKSYKFPNVITCDCGCGAPDPDCELDTRLRPVNESWAYNSLIRCHNNDVQVDARYTFCLGTNNLCAVVPLSWQCEAKGYDQRNTLSYGTNGQPDCHCGCGLWDPDCNFQDDPNVGVRCNTLNGEFDGWRTPSQNAVCTVDRTCIDVPETWTCPKTWYNEVVSGFFRTGGPNCDCNCGAPDPDCVFENSNGIPLICHDDEEDDSPAGNRFFCNTIGNNTCETAPDGWTCAGRRYNEIGTGLFGPNGKPDCDCGCGIWDPDCDDFTFRQRSEVGLLCGGANADELNPTEEDLNLSTFCDRGALQCDSTPPNYGSNCDPSRFNEIGQGIPRSEATCDCGCGAWDPDCLYTSNISIVCSPTGEVIEPGTLTCSPSTFLCIPVGNPDFEGPDVDYDEVDNGSNPDRPGGATCDCGLGAWDPDCDYQAFSDIVQSTCAPGQYCNRVTNQCTDPVIPSGEVFSCHPSLYNELQTGTFGIDGIPQCDCGCGTYDPDCDFQDRRFTQGLNSFGLICHENNDYFNNTRTAFCNVRLGQCGLAPSGWGGAPSWYDERNTDSFGRRDGPKCNCGNGIYDPDCDHGYELLCGPEASAAEETSCNRNCPKCTTSLFASSASSLAVGSALVVVAAAALL